MKLRDARLCMTCDEVYEAVDVYNCCPSCGSVEFRLLSCWVPTWTEYEKWIEEQKQRAESVAALSAHATRTFAHAR